MPRGEGPAPLGFDLGITQYGVMNIDAPEEVSEPVQPAKPDSEKVLRQKWRSSLDTGWTVIPSALIRGLPRLHIGAGELAVLTVSVTLYETEGGRPRELCLSPFHTVSLKY